MKPIKIFVTVTVFILLLSLNAASGGDIGKIYFTKTMVSLIDLRDPGFVVFGLENGDKINTVYAGIEFEVISEWLDQQKKNELSRIMYMTYSDTEGVLITDQDSGTTFKLIGEIKNHHPIDLAIDKCRKEAISTIDYQDCNSLEMNLWKIELSRIFKSLGDKSAQLEEVFDQYLYAYKEFLRSEYGNREGSIWGLEIQSHIIDLLRDQVNSFGRVREW